MSGTEWTEPGQGATWGDLHSAACGEDRWERITSDNEHKALLHIADLLRSHWFGAKTNLALTGAPLTAEDLERIGRAK